MSLIDTMTNAANNLAQSVTPKRRGRSPIPQGDATSAAQVEAKIEAVQKEHGALIARHPDLSLRLALAADVEESVPAAAALQELETEIAVKEKALAQLMSALEAAKRADDRLMKQQRAALYKKDVEEIGKSLRRRNDAALSLVVDLTKAIQSYRLMVEEAERAAARVRSLGANPSGYRLDRAELERDVLGELTRLNSPWPRTPEHDRLPHFPVGNRALELLGRGELQPLVDMLKAGSDGLLAELTGTAPSAD